MRLLAGGPGARRPIDRFFPMRNAAASSQIYTIDGREMLDVERVGRRRGGSTIVGVMHSHTHTTAYPSPTDVEDAARFDPFGSWHYVIVSLQHPEPRWSRRATGILDGRSSEEPIELVDGLRIPRSGMIGLSEHI